PSRPVENRSSPRKPRSRDNSQVRTNDLFRACPVSSGAVVGETTGSSLVRQCAGISVVRETTGISVVADIAVASHSLFAAGGDPTSAGTAHGSVSSTAAGSGSSLRGGARLGDGVILRMSAVSGLTRSGPGNRLRPQGGQA